MASRVITQETFDAVVQENIVEFDMDPEEALKEAILQFEYQGINLSNIVKAIRNPSSETGEAQSHDILRTLESLKKSVDSMSLAEMGEHLVSFTEQCKLDFAHRYLAAQTYAYPVVLSACKLSAGDWSVTVKALGAMAALTDGQPDLLEPEGQAFLIETLQQNANDEVVTVAAIRIVRHVCLKHEQNRQDLVKAGILPLLTGAIAKYNTQGQVVREACAALRVMTFDDDIRVPFGHAHDHAKMIVLEHNGLKVIIDAAKSFTDHTSVLSELCATLSRLAVRNEFCQDIVDLGGLNFMVALLADCIDHPDLVKQVLSAIRAIAGNDDVKDAIVNTGGTDLIVLAMNQHLANPQICEQGCAALCMLALRKQDNCKVIMEGGGAVTALQAMKIHPGEVNVQKQACMLIRNLVCRTQDFIQPILEMGAEALIVQARTSHREFYF
ncbi:armadillo repeat-containing protein 6 isoform X2 [Latimeria chalumnae]|uniref:armadillo repeat-containing protein 6 isoform X2 n=1 Tax=Latimeria chalumnae TaxID=7897 RepID=UPI0003C1AADF|nr:PREDICTED: armadillo repeat-containing protein 6 isoform X2 [Latimeria chalumnae]|eukprot:XP_006004003.1 PREDICTED: armadillo repeat-containing protein 6 isoform X2 [Latimeria chalumnae]